MSGSLGTASDRCPRLVSGIYCGHSPGLCASRYRNELEDGSGAVSCARLAHSRSHVDTKVGPALLRCVGDSENGGPGDALWLVDGARGPGRSAARPSPPPLGAAHRLGVSCRRSCQAPPPCTWPDPVCTERCQTRGAVSAGSSALVGLGVPAKAKCLKTLARSTG
jgi:hypothetical protein